MLQIWCMLPRCRVAESGNRCFAYQRKETVIYKSSLADGWSFQQVIFFSTSMVAFIQCMKGIMNLEVKKSTASTILYMNLGFIQVSLGISSVFHSQI